MKGVIRSSLAAMCLFTHPDAALGAVAPAPTHTEVAPGVHLFQTAPYGDAGLDGNSVAIVTDAGVLVFDANGTPAAARAVLAGIRRLTRQPVRWLVLSHWHWDHWYGAEVYAREFPGLAIVAHERTRALMAGPAVEFNRPGLETELPEHVRAVEEAAGRARDESRNADAERLAAHAAADLDFLRQKRAVRHTLPTLTFTDSLTLHLGGRVIRLRHPGPAITPGDTWLELPAERIVITGDVLVNPLTFALFCHPASWISALERLDALDAAVLVPGHGAPLRDERLLHDTHALLVRERELALAERAAGHDAGRARDVVLADAEVLRLRDAITGGDHSRDESFALYMVDWFVRRVFDEAEGGLGDGIPGVD